ncbi:MAG: hypothetical protein II970_03600 [Paludibacteraceae bacterium]|nr:hypothetical protein [Paludibacteraceae bacterium]
MMRNKITIIATLFSLLMPFASLYARRPQDRHVLVDTVCRCTPAQFQKTIDRFFYQFQNNSDSLFNWVYLNTGGDGNEKEGGKDAIKLHYAQAIYDPVEKTGDLGLDIYVLGSKMFPDRHLYTKNFGRKLGVTYSGSLLENGSVVFRLDSVAPRQTKVHYEFNFVFGKFFSLLISDKIWNEVIKWRLEQVFANLVEYTETGKVTDHKKKAGA